LGLQFGCPKFLKFFISAQKGHFAIFIANSNNLAQDFCLGEAHFPGFFGGKVSTAEVFDKFTWDPLYDVSSFYVVEDLVKPILLDLCDWVLINSCWKFCVGLDM
jgi:hypothetical protein